MRVLRYPRVTSNNLQYMHTSGTCHQKFRCSKFDDFFDHQIWGVGYKFSSRGFRKFFSLIFLAKNKSFEQKTPFETKNSGITMIFEDLSSSRKNPQNRIFTHFQISGEITKEMVFLRISGEITTDNWIFYSTDFRSMCLMCANHTFQELKRLGEYLRDQNF